MRDPKSAPNPLVGWMAAIAVLLAGFFVLKSLGLEISLKSENSLQNTLSTDSAVIGAPKIILEPQSIDLGKVDIDGGIVKTSSTIKNEGSGDLLIKNFETSCMCTTVMLKKGDGLSPRFGMPGHGASPAWSGTGLKPGEAAKLLVEFDPAAHGPSGLGFVKRAIFISSNDPQTPEGQFIFSAEVVEGNAKSGNSRGDPKQTFATFLPIVIGSAFLDGLHPCAFAVLIFFIAFLLSLQRSFANIFLLGSIYIAVIFLTYLGVGLGFWQGVRFLGQPHLIGKIGAVLIVSLGLINLIEYFFPRFPLRLRIPKFSQPALQAWLKKATLPAVIVAAFLVGLCTIPCAGGVYAGIIALLASKTTQARGFVYLVIYNLVFVVPLIVILLTASNRVVLRQIAEFQQKSEKQLKLAVGTALIIFGGIILRFLI